jgi:hypothetical protein
MATLTVTTCCRSLTLGSGLPLFFKSNAELGSTRKTELTGFVARISSQNDAWKVLVGPGLWHCNQHQHERDEGHASQD